jgi:predicted DNA binding CopG/RHH family protein
VKAGEHARLFLRKAEQDEFVLALPLGSPESPEEAVGFHAQQAVEKRIKAVLTSVRSTKMPKRKPIPMFESEDEEREFWAEHDSTEHVDWSQAKPATFANLKPSTRSISLRLPEALLDELKLLANKRDVPYQSLLKVFLAERVQQELGRR